MNIAQVAHHGSVLLEALGLSEREVIALTLDMRLDHVVVTRIAPASKRRVVRDGDVVQVYDHEVVEIPFADLGVTHPGGGVESSAGLTQDPRTPPISIPEHFFPRR